MRQYIACFSRLYTFITLSPYEPIRTWFELKSVVQTALTACFTSRVTWTTTMSMHWYWVRAVMYQWIRKILVTAQRPILLSLFVFGAWTFDWDLASGLWISSTSFRPTPIWPDPTLRPPLGIYHQSVLLISENWGTAIKLRHHDRPVQKRGSPCITSGKDPPNFRGVNSKGNL